MSIRGTKIRNCRLCKSDNLTKIIYFGKIPLGNNLQENFEQAINSEAFELGINCCERCKHFQLSYSVNKNKLFAENYTYLSSIGKAFRDHLSWSAEDIISKLNSKIKNRKNTLVFDIGSNDGTALSFFKKKGYNVLGIDPSYLPVQEAKRKEIPTINTFFSNKKSYEIKKKFGKIDLIISHNVLAHVENFIDVIKGIYNLLSNEGLFVFEVGYFGKMIEKKNI